MQMAVCVGKHLAVLLNKVVNLSIGFHPEILKTCIYKRNCTFCHILNFHFKTLMNQSISQFELSGVIFDNYQISWWKWITSMSYSVWDFSPFTLFPSACMCYRRSLLHDRAAILPRFNQLTTMLWSSNYFHHQSYTDWCSILCVMMTCKILIIFITISLGSWLYPALSSKVIGEQCWKVEQDSLRLAHVLFFKLKRTMKKKH